MFNQNHKIIFELNIKKKKQNAGSQFKTIKGVGEKFSSRAIRLRSSECIQNWCYQ